MFGSLFRSRPAEEKRGQQSWWNLAGAPGFISSFAYGNGSVEEGLRNAATWACIDVLADALARTPLDAMRGREAGRRRPVSPEPPILLRPSGVSLRDVWRYQLGWGLLTDGNSFGRIVTLDRLGYPTQIELVDPASVSQRDVKDGVARVVYDDERHLLWPNGDIWHVPGRMVPAGSPFGLSPIKYAAKAIGVSLSAEEFGHQFFTAGGHPTSIIYADTELTQEQADGVKRAWRRATEGREPAVLGSALKHEQVQVNPTDSQFIDVMRWEVEQACRFWRVPPAMVYAATSGQNVTYANVTDADLHYLKHSLDGYLVRLEEAMTDILPRPQYVKANRDVVLRADIKSRYDAHTVKLTSKFGTINEVRALEDEPPFKDPIYDKPGIPMPVAPAAPAPNGAKPSVPVASGNGQGD